MVKKYPVTYLVAKCTEIIGDNLSGPFAPVGSYIPGKPRHRNMGLHFFDIPVRLGQNLIPLWGDDNDRRYLFDRIDSKLREQLPMRRTSSARYLPNVVHADVYFVSPIKRIAYYRYTYTLYPTFGNYVITNSWKSKEKPAPELNAKEVAEVEDFFKPRGLIGW